MAKRNKLEIIKDILITINKNKEIKITPLIRKTNLSTNRFKEYYEELKNKEFIKEKEKGKNKIITITNKGQRYIEKYQTIIGFIEEFEL